jgi:hypothetical protein
LASKPAATDGFWRFGLKTSGDGFLYLILKLVVTISLDLVLKSAVGFLVEPQNQVGVWFFGLGIKIGSSDLLIWASKLPRRFLVLSFKIKQTSVYRLRHKTDGGRSARDTRRDLAASLDMVSQSGLKTGEDATTGGARNTNTEVASEVS